MDGTPNRSLSFSGVVGAEPEIPAYPAKTILRMRVCANEEQ